MISNLDIQVQDTNNCKILKLVDNSVYNPNVPVTNAIVEVTPPGYDCAVFFEVVGGFSLFLTSASLKIAPAAIYADLMNLPDGIYHIKYSINPNSKLYVEYDYLRNCNQKQMYIKLVCDVFENECNACDGDFKKNIEQLRWIKQLIEASKFKVEDCDEPERGLELYNEASAALIELNKCSRNCHD